MLYTYFRAANMRWLGLEKISGYGHHMQTFEAPRTVAIACFYISVFLFFEMAWVYCKEMLYYSESNIETIQFESLREEIERA